jgi:predicted nucleic acid-binding protein
VSLVFVDTAYFVALLNPDDSYHSRTLESFNESSRRLVTTEFVLLELGNYFSRRSNRHLVRPFWRSLLDEETATVVPVSVPLLERALDLYHARQDKEWSLVDCTSFIIMEDLGIHEVLTTDQHFEQAGFTRVL